jgi:hypothetical protein
MRMSTSTTTLCRVVSCGIGAVPNPEPPLLGTKFAKGGKLAAAGEGVKVAADEAGAGIGVARYALELGAGIVLVRYALLLGCENPSMIVGSTRPVASGIAQDPTDTSGADTSVNAAPPTILGGGEAEDDEVPWPCKLAPRDT